jgi:hypothetical protein
MEITWHMGTMGLREQESNGTDASGGDEGGEDTGPNGALLRAIR